jgi:hypothetical protein
MATRLIHPALRNTDDILGAHQKFASLRSGFAGVNHQILDYLRKLNRITNDRIQIALKGKLGFELRSAKRYAAVRRQEAPIPTMGKRRSGAPHVFRRRWTLFLRAALLSCFSHQREWHRLIHGTLYQRRAQRILQDTLFYSGIGYPSITCI